ncbi:MAG: 4Fe-4S dicluster domain-containing protein [Dehalococcoidia bacterium]|nr:MAG: 4Fe-4S dicluster domain-containing protein [Dehalococcoidia bacterium]
MTVSKRVVLHFPRNLVDQPIIYRLVRDYDLMFNILKASVTPKEEGLLVLELSGEEKDYEKGVGYLAEVGVEIQSLSRDVYRDEVQCTHCGACITICPTHAFELEPSTRKVNFLDEKCIACGLCIKACPPRAMEIRI